MNKLFVCALLASVAALVSARPEGSASQDPECAQGKAAFSHLHSHLPADVQAKLEDCHNKFPHTEGAPVQPCAVKCYFTAKGIIENGKPSLAKMNQHMDAAEAHSKQAGDTVLNEGFFDRMKENFEACHKEANFDGANANDESCAAFGTFKTCLRQRKEEHCRSR